MTLSVSGTHVKMPCPQDIILCLLMQGGQKTTAHNYIQFLVIPAPASIGWDFCDSEKLLEEGTQSGLQQHFMTLKVRRTGWGTIKATVSPFLAIV